MRSQGACGEADVKNRRRVEEKTRGGREMNKKIDSHFDLQVYGKAFEAAMQRIGCSQCFPRGRHRRSPTRFDGPLAPCVQIWRRLGANIATQQLSLWSFPMRRRRLLRPKAGSSSP